MSHSMGKVVSEFVPRAACPLPGSAQTAQKPCCFLAQVLEFTGSAFCQQTSGTELAPKLTDYMTSSLNISVSHKPRGEGRS